ncbi:MAG: type II toxin-antitoxin system RelE/ParE family toxin [Lachnospirales bacterium]
MDRYSVKLLSMAYKNLDEIYEYISEELLSEQSAENLIDDLEEAILSLETMPNRGAKRRNGIFANKGYRQIFVRNFIIVYRVDDENKEVVVVTVKYSKSGF